MHQNAFDGRALPDPLRRLSAPQALLRPGKDKKGGRCFAARKYGMKRREGREEKGREGKRKWMSPLVLKVNRLHYVE